ncbi:MAG: gluconokinase [Thermodesulfobacteriota bacterium]
MNQGWYLGIDLGTGSCKSLVLSREARPLGFASMEYCAQEVSRRWQEQDPDTLLGAALSSAKAAMEKAMVDPSHCKGLSLGGALHSLVPLDKSGRPLAGLMTWADDRAFRQASELRGSSLAAELYQETGCPVHPMYPLYKILWLRQERPEVFRKARRFVSGKEYVLWKLTGEFLVDYSVASGSGLLGVRSLRWSPLCLEVAGIQQRHLSEPAPPVRRLGALRGWVSQELGLPRDVPVFLGSSDAVNSSLGAGATRSNQATCMVGTSGALRIVSTKPILDPGGRTWCYALDEGHWLVGGAINNGGVALSWLVDCINEALCLAGQKRLMGFEDLLVAAQKVEPGADGVMCLPFFAGERSPNWNVHARAAFLGLSLKHGLGHLSRSLIEGIGYRFRSIQEVFSELGIELGEVVASGGFTRSAFWLQVMADILGIPLTVPQWGETSAMGAVLWALLGTGALPGLEQMAAVVRQEERVYPQEINRALYDRLFSLYKISYEAMESLWTQMAEARP